MWKPRHEYVRLSSKVSRFVLDWKGLGRERVGGWRAALFMCQPPGGLGHLGHLPPSCAVLRATNNFTNINTNTRDRPCILTLMSSCQHRFVCLDIQAFLESGIIGKTFSYQAVIFATGQPMRFVQIICKTMGGYTGPSSLQQGGLEV